MDNDKNNSLIQERIAHLESLLKNIEENRNDILWSIRVLTPIDKYDSSSESNSIFSLKPETIDLLNRAADTFISAELTNLLGKNSLKKYSFYFVAHHFFNVEDVVDDIAHGEVLKKIIPTGSFNKLKKELIHTNTEPTPHQNVLLTNSIQPSTKAKVIQAPIQLQSSVESISHKRGRHAIGTSNEVQGAANEQLMTVSRKQMDPIQAQISNVNSSENKIRLAQRLKDYCEPLGKKENGILLLKLSNMTRNQSYNPHGTVNRYVFGEPSTVRPICKTIILVGATGSGKTTLINAMVNYILDVYWEDPFRFVLIQEESSSNQAHSQTKNISVYELHYQEGFTIPYSLIIIDTPGYEDTEGLDRDKEMTDTIYKLFKDRGGIQEINAVGFVVQATVARLTHTQTYIFESILEIFGRDIQDNINFLVTFTDGQTPPVLAAIKEANISQQLDEKNQPRHHRFNNSGFFASNQIDDEDLNHMFWDLGIKNFQSFFSSLEKMSTKSLSLTEQVIEERQRLGATIQGLSSRLQQQLTKLEELHRTKLIIENHSDRMSVNQDFNYEVVVLNGQKIATSWGKKSTNCSLCNISCHYPCSESSIDFAAKYGSFELKRSGKAFSDGGINKIVGNMTCKLGPVDLEYKRTCSAMGADNNCTVCPNRCKWEQHNYESYKWEFVEVKEVKTYSELKKRYEDAREKKLSAEEVLKELVKEFEDMKRLLKQDVKTITRCLKRLNEIALRPDSSNSSDYIQMLIGEEQRVKKPGYNERIGMLKELLSDAQ